MAYPTNVLHIATETGNRQHSAAFPKALPEWFIKLLTKPGDVVLDPFLGSGTTCIAALEMHRKAIGIEIKKEYYDLAKMRIAALTQTTEQSSQAANDNEHFSVSSELCRLAMQR